MINAMQEFKDVSDGKNVVCATISLGNPDSPWCESETFNLKIGYSSVDFASFLSYIDFDYDNGYGGQELFGTIWFEDGVWASRGEYDGSEWWDVNVVPDIPETIK